MAVVIRRWLYVPSTKSETGSHDVVVVMVMVVVVVAVSMKLVLMMHSSGDAGGGGVDAFFFPRGSRKTPRAALLDPFSKLDCDCSSAEGLSVPKTKRGVGRK